MFIVNLMLSCTWFILLRISLAPYTPSFIKVRISSTYLKWCKIFGLMGKMNLNSKLSINKSSKNGESGFAIARPISCV